MQKMEGEASNELDKSQISPVEPGTVLCARQKSVLWPLPVALIGGNSFSEQKTRELGEHDITEKNISFRAEHLCTTVVTGSTSVPVFVPTCSSK